MADEIRDLSGQVVLDTTDAKVGAAEMTRAIRVLESGFRSSAAALGDWGNTAEGLEMRIKTLSGQIDIQQLKVSKLQKEYEKVASEKGATSKASQDLQIKLNKETETLGKMQRELAQTDQSLAEMGKESLVAAKDVDVLEKSEKETTSATERLKSVVGGLGAALKVGVAAIAGLAVAAAGAGAAIGKLVLDSADAAGELVDLSLKTGLSTTRLQELAYVAGQVGTSTEDITGSMAKLTRSMGSARDQATDYAKKLAQARAEAIKSKKPLEMPELGDAAKAFQVLGVSIVGSGGKLRDNEAVFADALTALGKVGNETERDALAMSIFGKSAQELNPLIKAGADEIARLSKEAYGVGAVMSEKDVSALEAFGDELASLQAGLKGTLGTLAAAFLPGFQGLVDSAKNYLGDFVDILNESEGDLSLIAENIGDLLGRMISETAAKIPSLLQAGLNIVKGIGSAIMQNLPMLIQSATEMVNALVIFLVQNLPGMMDAGAQLLLALVNGIIPMLPMLIEAAVQMIVTLANGIADALPQIMPIISEVIPRIILVLVENMPLLIDAALKLIMALADGLIQALPVLIEHIPEIMQAIYNALNESMPMILQAGAKLIEVLWKGVQSVGPTLLKVGKFLIDGVWKGIQDNAKWFMTQVQNFFGNIVANVKKAMGIKSPSTVFAGIGENMALGLGVGFMGAFGDIERAMSGAVGGLAMASAGAGRVTNNMGGVHIAIGAGATVDRNSVANMATMINDAIERSVHELYGV